MFCVNTNKSDFMNTKRQNTFYGLFGYINILLDICYFVQPCISDFISVSVFSWNVCPSLAVFPVHTKERS